MNKAHIEGYQFQSRLHGMQELARMNARRAIRKIQITCDPQEVEYEATSACWCLVGQAAAQDMDCTLLSELQDGIKRAALVALERIEAAREVSVYRRISPSLSFFLSWPRES